VGHIARVPQDGGDAAGNGAGLTARQIADQLGQSQVSVTQDFYMGRKIASEDTVRVLEIIGRPVEAAIIKEADKEVDE
jgi:cyanate lyase